MKFAVYKTDVTFIHTLLILLCDSGSSQTNNRKNLK